MKKLLLAGLIFFIHCTDDAPSPVSGKKNTSGSISAAALQLSRFHQRIDSLLPLAKKVTRSKGFNEKYLFVADLSLHSGLERLAVIDLETDSILHKGLVAHGAGGRYFSATARYSNTPNSLCSSPGKYKEGAKYTGRFGKAYKLHGLDNSNSKAFERFIVLHGYDCVPDVRTFPEYLCNSEGCPMVSYNFLDILSQYIDNSKKPVLLWIVG